jgi:hypothetical protein
MSSAKQDPKNFTEGAGFNLEASHECSNIEEDGIRKKI